MKVTDLILNAVQICGNNFGEGKLLSVSPAYEYVNGKATKNIIGYKYLTVFESNNYEKISIKVLGEAPAVTNESIKQHITPPKIIFKNLSGRFYRSGTGEYLLSANAEDAEVIFNELDN